MIPSVLDDTVWLLKTPTQVLGLVMGPSCSSECRAALNHPKSYLAGCHNTLTCLAQIRVQAYRTYSKCRSARFVLDFNRGPALRHLATTIVKCRQQSQILCDIMECFYPSEKLIWMHTPQQSWQILYNCAVAAVLWTVRVYMTFWRWLSGSFIVIVLRGRMPMNLPLSVSGLYDTFCCQTFVSCCFYKSVLVKAI